MRSEDHPLSGATYTELGDDKVRSAVRLQFRSGLPWGRTRPIRVGGQYRNHTTPIRSVRGTGPKDLLSVLERGLSPRTIREFPGAAGPVTRLMSSSSGRSGRRATTTHPRHGASTHLGGAVAKT